MAGHSVIINGTRLFVDYPDAHGEAVVNGRKWRWDFHHYCGPLWLRKDGEPLKCQYPTRKDVWDVFTRWHKRYQRNRSKDAPMKPTKLTNSVPDNPDVPQASPSATCSGEADPLISELRSLATTKYPLCPEARLMLEMAVDAQLGKPIDLQRLIPNDKLRHGGENQ